MHPESAPPPDPQWQRPFPRRPEPGPLGNGLHGRRQNFVNGSVRHGAGHGCSDRLRAPDALAVVADMRVRFRHGRWPRVNVARAVHAHRRNAHGRAVGVAIAVVLAGQRRPQTRRRLRLASNSDAPPRLNSSCVATFSSQAFTTSSSVSLPLHSRMVRAVSRANSVSSVDQDAPLWKSVVMP